MPTSLALLIARLRTLEDTRAREGRASQTGGPGGDIGASLRTLVREGLADLPLPSSAGSASAGLPGASGTLLRWQCLAAVAAKDLSLAKLYEGHTDALAILAEAKSAAVPGLTYAMWAAEAPDVRLVGHRTGDGEVRLDGIKAWCSGAASVDRGLLTFRDQDGVGPWLADVDLRQPGVACDATAWHAVGMADSASADVRFESTPARVVGGPNFYLERPGFWQGGAGIAACWHGATCALADALLRSARACADPGWPRLLALGRVDRLLCANAALLREAAAWIDAHPRADARTWALRVRAAADDAAQEVLALVTRALGATPLCRDADFARRAADLPVFIRQCHGDRDLASLGGQLLTEPELPWTL